jgi:hypothetical protein
MISPQTMTAWKDFGQLLGYFVAVPVAVVGLIKAIYEIGASRKQRAEELRWKQANAAKELLDDIHNHELAKQAVHMLDSANPNSRVLILRQILDKRAYQTAFSDSLFFR